MKKSSRQRVNFLKKTNGFSLLEVFVIMGVSLLILLGCLSFLKVVQKAGKQTTELETFYNLKATISAQLSQMSGADCLKYFPPASNPTIRTGLMQQTPMTLMEEITSANKRFSSPVKGVQYEVILTVLDNSCTSGASSPPCTGALNLKATRVSTNPSNYFGLKNISVGLIANSNGGTPPQYSIKENQGALGNINFTMSGTEMGQCEWQPSVMGGVIDQNICANATGFICPSGYLAVWGASDFVNFSSLTCCRLKDPTQITAVEWRNSACLTTEAVSGICDGAGCPGYQQCSEVGASIIQSFCYEYTMNRDWIGITGCNPTSPYQIISGFCPSSKTCSSLPGSNSFVGVPGSISCCPIIH